MKFDSIRIHSAPEALVQQIAEQIENGTLARGVCLPSQRNLAKMFNVGLGTVREAVRILNVMGYLNVIQGKGTFVSDISESAQQKWARFDKAIEAVSLADLMKAREIVESEVARLAAKDADDDSIQRLKAITAKMEASFTDTEAFYTLDFDFHMAVADAANNDALYEIVKLLVDRATTISASWTIPFTSRCHSMLKKRLPRPGRSSGTLNQGMATRPERKWSAI